MHVAYSELVTEKFTTGTESTESTPIPDGTNILSSSNSQIFSSTPFIAGIAAGGGVLLLMFILAAILIRKKKKNFNEKKEETELKENPAQQFGRRIIGN